MKTPNKENTNNPINYTMKYKHINTLAAIAGLALTASSANAALLAVDFTTGTTPLESGFVLQSGTNAVHSTTAGNITVDVAGSQGLFNYTTNIGTAHPDLFQDFYFKNGGTMTLTLSGPGISADTAYDMTFWSLYAAEARNTTITATAGTTGTTLGPIAYEINPTSLSQNAASGTFTSDSSGNLTLFVGGTNNRPALNGFSMDVVPEPSTTALLGLGGLALILRRRK